MPVISSPPSFFTGRVSSYVPAMRYAADVAIDGATRISFGSPAAASATLLLNAQSIATAGSTVTFGGVAGPFQLDARYGRCLSVVASGAATSNVTVFGRDFYGQPMAESFTLNGTTPVVGLKAFKWIDRVTFGATGATTINLGSNTKIGLPYKTIKVLSEELAQVISGTLGTVTSPVLTDPQTTITGDPRGTYTSNATMNGTELTGTFLFSADVNAAGNGGLMGIKHVAS